MKIAIPITDGQICMHFGHCKGFRFFEVDEKTKTIISTNYISAPAHEPGILPKWIDEQGANVVLANGIGNKAKELFLQYDIKVIAGVAETDPKKAVLDFLSGKLIIEENICNH